jgi:hypothetical protein
MALSDEVIARYSAQRIIEWTNPDATSALSADATRLARACTDAQAEFEIRCGVAFDVTDARHVAVAVRGVRAYLLSYTDSPSGKDAMSAYHRELADVAKVTGRDRILPTTNSNLEPSPVPRTPGTTARPGFDDSVFDAVTPQPPSGGRSADWSGDDDE